MIPSSPRTIVHGLLGRTIQGATRMDNGMLALVFEGDAILVISDKAYLLHDTPAQQVLASARKRLDEAAAELTTLGGHEAPQPSVKDQARKMRDEAEVASVLKSRANGTRKVIDHVIGTDEPAFLDGPIVGLNQSDTQIRARTEAIAREVPDIR